MIFAKGFKVEFVVERKTYRCQVDKMVINGHRPERFYRVSSKNGNRDIICHQGQWLVIFGRPLPNNILDALGDAIERTEGDI